MLNQEFGSFLVGFTGVMKCKHCNNEKPMQIRQDYVKQRVFLIPIPTAHNKVFLFCPVCEKKDTLVGWKPMFAGQDQINYIVELLNAGKSYTKHWVGTLDYKDKEAVLKRLNSLNAHELVRYIGS